VLGASVSAPSHAPAAVGAPGVAGTPGRSQRPGELVRPTGSFPGKGRRYAPQTDAGGSGSSGGDCGDGAAAGLFKVRLEILGGEDRGSPTSVAKLAAAEHAEHRPVVYWERQGQDCLCAVHCLNALLQGPHFTAMALAEIAQELDREEGRLLRNCSSSSNSSSKPSNVDVRGNFSSQVLFRALQRWGDLNAVDSRHADVRSDITKQPESETGYICNLRKHWVALRKVPWSGGTEAWFNLNSRGASGPTKVGEEWLASFLASASADSDTVFVVRGRYQLPCPERLMKPLESHQMFLDDEGLQRLRDEERDRQAAEVHQALGDAAESPLAAAAAASQPSAGTPRLVTGRQAMATVAVVEDVDSPLLPGQVLDPWRVVWSDTEAAYYYWNTLTGVTQWEHPSEQAPLDGTLARRLIELARAGEWQALLPELAHAELEQRTCVDGSGASLKKCCRFVDYVPSSPGEGLLHLAARQGQAWAVQRLLEDFGAQPNLRTVEGLTASDIAWAAGHAPVLGVLLRPELSTLPQQQLQPWHPQHQQQPRHSAAWEAAHWT